jgi:PIN domain nuclease of toxin-antitoxin system
LTDHLLDTNALLIMALESGFVAPAVRAAFSEGRRFVSHVCAIEIAVKQSIGKLPLPPPFETDFAYAFTQMVSRLGAQVLPIDLRHVATLSRLPTYHRDPFDRLIIAQALSEDLTVITRDSFFSAYPGLPVLRI